MRALWGAAARQHALCPFCLRPRFLSACLAQLSLLLFTNQEFWLAWVSYMVSRSNSSTTIGNHVSRSVKVCPRAGEGGGRTG